MATLLDLSIYDMKLGGYLEFPTNSNFSASTGTARVQKHSDGGLILQAVTGVTYDFRLLNNAGTGILSVPTGTLTVMLAGDVKMANNKTLFARNNANSADLRVIALGTSDQVFLGSSSSIMALGTPGSLVGAVAGDVVIDNSKGYRGTNSTANGTKRLMTVDSNSRITIGDNSTDIRFDMATTALGGGATATLGTIGGSGPGTAAQGQWMKFFDSSSGAFWIPIWR